MIQNHPQSRRLVAWEETKANVYCPQLQLHLSWEGLYYSPRAANHTAVDTSGSSGLGFDMKRSRGSFHQANLQAAGIGAEIAHSLSFSIYFQLPLEMYNHMLFMQNPFTIMSNALQRSDFLAPIHFVWY